MLTNIVRACCALIDLAFVVAISVATTRAVARWARRRRPAAPPALPIAEHQSVRVLRSVSPDRPVR